MKDKNEIVTQTKFPQSIKLRKRTQQGGNGQRTGQVYNAPEVKKLFGEKSKYRLIDKENMKHLQWG